MIARYQSDTREPPPYNAKTDPIGSVSAFIQFRGLNLHYSGAEGGS